jgi:hypothetical protein
MMDGKNIDHPLEEIKQCQIGGTNVKVLIGTKKAGESPSLVLAN